MVTQKGIPPRVLGDFQQKSSAQMRMECHIQSVERWKLPANNTVFRKVIFPIWSVVLSQTKFKEFITARPQVLKEVVQAKTKNTN